jgi:hypothetical protein
MPRILLNRLFGRAENADWPDYIQQLAINVFLMAADD